MTFTVGHVVGGTHAGWRRVKQKPGPWFCDCKPTYALDFRNAKPGHLTRCPDCKKERPDA